MLERQSQLVIRTLTLRGWRERAVEPGEEVTINNKPLQIDRLQLVSGYPEGQLPPPPRENISITSHFRQGARTALQVTRVSEGGTTHTQLLPLFAMPEVRKRRGVSTAIREFAKHGVIAEFVSVRVR